MAQVWHRPGRRRITPFINLVVHLAVRPSSLHKAVTGRHTGVGDRRAAASTATGIVQTREHCSAGRQRDIYGPAAQPAVAAHSGQRGPGGGGGQRRRPGKGGRASLGTLRTVHFHRGGSVVRIVIAAIALTPSRPPKEAQKQPHKQAHMAGLSAPTGSGVAANRDRRPARRAVEAGLYPWQLQAPISREVLVPEVSGQGLIVAGGLVANGSSASGAFRLDTEHGETCARRAPHRPRLTMPPPSSLTGRSLSLAEGPARRRRPRRTSPLAVLLTFWVHCPGRERMPPP